MPPPAMILAGYLFVWGLANRIGLTAARAGNTPEKTILRNKTGEKGMKPFLKTMLTVTAMAALTLAGCGGLWGGGFLGVARGVDGYW